MLNQHQQPNWQPLSQLPLIAAAIDDMTASTEEQLRQLQAAESQSCEVDDATIERVITIAFAHQAHLCFCEEQLARWRKQALSADQPIAIERLDTQLARLCVLIDDLLIRAQALHLETIDVVMTKADVKPDLAFLSGEHP